MTTRIVELRRGILKKNDELAAGLRTRYSAAGVLVLNLVSSPGTGKTAFLELTLRELRARGARVAALVGDLETDNDARRLASSGAPVRQINTHGICHLDADMIDKHLAAWEGVDIAQFPPRRRPKQTQNPPAVADPRRNETSYAIVTADLLTCYLRVAEADLLHLFHPLHLDCPMHHPTGTQFLLRRSDSRTRKR
jgi:hypothetical protein